MGRGASQGDSRGILHYFCLLSILLALVSAPHSLARGRTPEDLPPVVAKLIEYEQTLNDKIEDKRYFAGSLNRVALPKELLPQNRPLFPLATVLVPLDETIIYQTTKNLPADVFVEGPNGRSVKFFIHPQSHEAFEGIISRHGITDELTATPTASHRSLYAWNPADRSHPLSLKVSLDVTIGAYSRLLTRDQIERAAAMSAAFHQIEHSELAARGIEFVDEPFHVLLKKPAYGYTLRTIPEVRAGRELMPMFSLYSKGSRSQTPLAEMIEASGLPARKFVVQNIIDPMVSHMVYLAFEHGLVGEVHEQNVLVEVVRGRNGQGPWLSGRFFYRDLAGFSVNEGLRRAAGKKMDFFPEGITAKCLDDSEFVDSARGYLRRSNFFALQKSLRDSYPEITSKWVEQVFREALARYTHPYLGERILNLRTLNQRIHERERGDRCEKLLVRRAG